MEDKQQIVGSGGIVIDAATILKRIEELEQKEVNEQNGD